MENTDNKIIDELLNYSLGIQLNANDFFAYASADSVFLDTWDIKILAPIIEKYHGDGINAIMSFIEKKEPLKEYKTEKFLQAYKDLEELNPDLNSL